MKKGLYKCLRSFDIIRVKNTPTEYEWELSMKFNGNSPGREGLYMLTLLKKIREKLIKQCLKDNPHVTHPAFKIDHKVKENGDV